MPAPRAHRRPSADDRTQPEPRRPRAGAAARAARRAAAGRRDRRRAAPRCVAAFAAGTGPVGDRRRARLRLPLLRPRLPRPAAPRGLRHRAGRPDRRSTTSTAARTRPSATPSGSCTPPPRTCPACAEVGLRPTALFDTELAGRLLGYPRVGLATLVETVVGRSLRKEHSAVDWSTRPLPEPWLEYAALDVEVLVELRDALGRRARGDRQGRVGPPGVRAPASAPSRTARAPTRGAAPRACTGSAAAARWPPYASCGRPATRSPPAATSPRAGSSRTRRSSRPPTRCPPTRPRCCGTKGFHGRGAERYAAPVGRGAARRPATLPEDELPARWPRGRRTAAAARLGRPGPGRRRPAGARPATRSRRSPSEHDLPVENLLTPDFVRRVMWEPPAGARTRTLPGAGRRAAGRLGARPWQVELTCDLLSASAILSPAGRPPRGRRETSPEPSAALRSCGEADGAWAARSRPRTPRRCAGSSVSRSSTGE